MQKSTRKNIVSAIITLLILAVAGFIFKTLSNQKKSTVSDKVVKKERRTIKYATFSSGQAKNDIEIDGRLQAHDRVSVTSKVQGIMQPTNTKLRAGSYIKKGDLLFTVDNREALFNLKAQRSSLMTAISQLMPDLKFDHPQSFDKWQQYLNGFSVDQPTKPFPQPSTDQEKYFISGKNIYTQYYNIKSQETRLSEYVIYAPFSGIITAVNVFPGALISPGQVLATMINTSTYEITAPVPLENLKYITTGQQVELQSKELGKSWNGKVSRIGTLIDPNTQNIPLYISVSGKGLKDGMYLTGSLKGKSLTEVTQLPKNIFLTPNSIYVVEDSTLIAKTIVPIKRESEYVYVKGLSSDDKVVIGSLAGLYQGQKVNY